MRKQLVILSGIVLIAAVLRFIGLGKNPPGLYWDEVSLGWNAYSIFKTGFDEHGRFLPVDTFYAFGDYKPPGYIYAAVPSIALFGLNEFAVRFPSALAGTLTVLVTYWLVKELVDQKVRRALHVEHREDSAHSVQRTTYMALISAFLLAISPWSVTLSRVAFESNLAVLLNAVGVLLFLFAINRSPRWLLASIVSFVLSAYTFNANRLLAPLMLVGLTAIYWREAVRYWKWWIASAVLGVLLIVPVLGHLRSPEGKLRWQEVNIFSDLQVVTESNRRREVDGNSLLSRIAHHRYTGYARLFLGHYLDHFDLNYLFLDGDPNPRISIPDIGQLYLIELPFLFIGLISLISPIRQIGLIKSREKAMLFLWILMAAVPAGLARETPHALRSASTLPVPHIIVGLGITTAAQYLAKLGYRKLSLFLFPLFLLLVVSLAYFQLVYWRYYPREWAGEWLTSYKQLVSYVTTVEGSVDTIYITPDLGRPYVYVLFYKQYDPERFISDAKNGGRTGDAFGFFNVLAFDKYRFYVPPLEDVRVNDLVVTRADSPPAGFELLETITDIDDRPQFNVIRKR